MAAEDDDDDFTAAAFNAFKKGAVKGTTVDAPASIDPSPSKDPEALSRPTIAPAQFGRSSMFERSLSDFVGKRYGAGEAFYGARLSDLSEGEYQEMSAAKAKDVYAEPPPRDNAILVVGSLDGVGQWVAYDLVEKGFAVRVCGVDRQRLVDTFGLPGKNVDMVELRAGMQQDAFFRALEGVQAVVLCGNFNKAQVGEQEQALQRDLLRSMAMARAGGGSRAVAKLEVKKVVCVSRLVPWAGASAAPAFSASRLLDLFAANKAVDDPAFVSQHLATEEAVRSSGLDYVVVRAPPVVEMSREGSSEDLLLLQGDEAGLTQQSALSRRIATVAGDTGGLSVGCLDLAECVVQALIQDVAATTFTVCSDPRARFEDDDAPLAQSNAMEAVYGPPPAKRRKGTDRLPRDSFYSILEMADSDMRASYLLRPANAYRRQLEEDEGVEEYWLGRLEVLGKDLR